MTNASPAGFNALAQITEILERENQSPATSIDALYDFIFANETHNSTPGRLFRLCDSAKWNWLSVTRTVASIEPIVALYVQKFQDPRELPVTHSKRQKRVAIHLDEQFGPVLREAVVRSGLEALREEDGSPAKDPFLDEPILFMKQQARAKDFPKAKKNGGVSLPALRERFMMKLTAKGFRDVPPAGERFEIKTPE